MIIKVLDGTPLDELKPNSHKKIRIRCDYPGCNFEWDAEYRYHSHKEVQLCRKHQMRSQETRIKLSDSNIGPNNPNYKNGNSSKYHCGRENVYYKLWRDEIRNRAKGLCEICGGIGTDVHHNEESYIDILNKVCMEIGESKIENMYPGEVGRLIGKYHRDHDVPGMWVCRECHIELEKETRKKKKESKKVKQSSVSEAA